MLLIMSARYLIWFTSLYKIKILNLKQVNILSPLS